MTAQVPQFGHAGKLALRGIFSHAWDLEGGDEVFDWARASGLNAFILASTYHQGWFIHPQHPRHRVFMCEGDVCYFRPREELFRGMRLRPTLSRTCAEVDWLHEAGRHMGSDLRLVAWTVGAHNTTLGTRFPELTQQNAFGDRLPHALCPAQEEVQQYLEALVKSLATSYPLWGVQLEAFGWMGFVHGHHHERDLVGLSALEQELMGLCFCDACCRRARSAGIDPDAAKKTVRAILDAAFREAPDRPRNHPVALADVADHCEDFGKFLAWRKDFLRALVRRIKQKALLGTNCRLLLQTEFDAELADVVDGFACAAYGRSPLETARICTQAAAAKPSEWQGLLQCFIQLGVGVPRDQNELKEIIAAVGENGCNGVSFYNLSESPPKMLRWLSEVLPDLV